MRILRTHRGRLAPLVALLMVALLTMGLLISTGCSSLSNTEKGAAAGAGAGAVLGGVIGKTASNDAAKGAIIGTVVGGTVGAIIGQQMDKQAKELDEELEGANVATVKNPETGETAGIEITFDSALLFDFASDKLRSESRRDLGDLSQSLQNYPNTNILIVGHTDDVGSDGYNQDLSERRARSAASFLRDRGVSYSRLTTLGKGESEPVASNESDYGRQQNRRVEVAIYASEEYREEVSRQQQSGG